jgi:exodeoxyribonuclease V alpha subunit
MNNPTPTITNIIIPTQIAAQLKIRAFKEKKPTNFYLDQYRAELAAKAFPSIQNPIAATISESQENDSPRTLLSASEIVLNEQQQAAVNMALSGQSFCLIGPAGTGKTATVNTVINRLISGHKIPTIGETTKVFRASNYGIVGCAFTRRARDNLQRNSPEALPCSTLHNLIEFAPVKKPTINAKGDPATTMVFEPQRHKDNPLPINLTYLIIDEASMVSTDLYEQVMDAIHPMSKLIIILIGDLAQLPPVFGHAILGFKLLEWPVVELTKVYRQKDGEILDFATQVRQGIEYKSHEFKGAFFNNPRLHIYTSKQVESVERRTYLGGLKIQELIHTGQVDPEKGDLILCPYNKQFGTIELNNWAADYYDQRDSRLVYTVVAGYQKKHFAVGDKILVDKQDALILSIEPNVGYTGRIPPSPSKRISRWGSERAKKYLPPHLLNADPMSEEDELSFEEDHMAGFMGTLEEALAEQEKGTNQASHIIQFQYIDSGAIGNLKTTGEINNLELSYCISVHKSQGSQASTVVLFLSRHHKRLQCRELLYTAATRAINKLIIYADPDSINKCIRTPIVRGDSLADKAEYFKGIQKERQAKEKAQADFEEDIIFA